MTITSRVKSELFDASSDGQLIRIPAEPAQPRRTSPASSSSGPPWTPEEHNRFLQALEMYPSGPWKRVATHVGSKTARQVMTHAQKYRQKIARRKRGLKICTAYSRQSAQDEGDEQMEDSAEAASAAAAPQPCDPYLDNEELEALLLDAEIEIDWAFMPDMTGLLDADYVSLFNELANAADDLDDCIVEELEPLVLADGILPPGVHLMDLSE